MECKVDRPNKPGEEFVDPTQAPKSEDTQKRVREAYQVFASE